MKQTNLSKKFNKNNEPQKLEFFSQHKQSSKLKVKECFILTEVIHMFRFSVYNYALYSIHWPNQVNITHDHKRNATEVI